jgi:hypothetical protein
MFNPHPRILLKNYVALLACEWYVTYPYQPAGRKSMHTWSLYFSSSKSSLELALLFPFREIYVHIKPWRIFLHTSGDPTLRLRESCGQATVPSDLQTPICRVSINVGTLRFRLQKKSTVLELSLDAMVNAISGILLGEFWLSKFVFQRT